VQTNRKKGYPPSEKHPLVLRQENLRGKTTTHTPNCLAAKWHLPFEIEMEMETAMSLETPGAPGYIAPFLLVLHSPPPTSPPPPVHFADNHTKCCHLPFVRFCHLPFMARMCCLCAVSFARWRAVSFAHSVWACAEAWTPWFLASKLWKVRPGKYF